MVHVEDNFIGPKGLVKIGDAAAAKHGLAVLGIFFYIDNSKPQVNYLFHKYGLVLLYFYKENSLYSSNNLSFFPFFRIKNLCR